MLLERRKLLTKHRRDYGSSPEADSDTEELLDQGVPFEHEMKVKLNHLVMVTRTDAASDLPTHSFMSARDFVPFLSKMLLSEAMWMQSRTIILDKRANEWPVTISRAENIDVRKRKKYLWSTNVREAFVQDLRSFRSQNLQLVSTWEDQLLSAEGISLCAQSSPEERQAATSEAVRLQTLLHATRMLFEMLVAESIRATRRQERILHQGFLNGIVSFLHFSFVSAHDGDSEAIRRGTESMFGRLQEAVVTAKGLSSCRDVQSVALFEAAIAPLVLESSVGTRDGKSDHCAEEYRSKPSAALRVAGVGTKRKRQDSVPAASGVSTKVARRSAPAAAIHTVPRNPDQRMFQFCFFFPVRAV